MAENKTNLPETPLGINLIGGGCLCTSLILWAKAWRKPEWKVLSPEGPAVHHRAASAPARSSRGPGGVPHYFRVFVLKNEERHIIIVGSVIALPLITCRGGSHAPR